MLVVLDEKNLQDENETLRGFYRVSAKEWRSVDNAAGKQKILIELYDNFFTRLSAGRWTSWVLPTRRLK